MPTFKTYIYSNDGNTLYGMETTGDPGGPQNVVAQNGIVEINTADWTAHNGATISEADNSFILPITIQGLTLTANSTNIDVAIGQSIISGNTYYCVEAATPTLTFKHFYDAGTIGSGTVKFRHYSQTEPTPSGYTDCLTFTGETSDFTLAIGSEGAKEWDGTLQWSTNHTNWTTLVGREAMQSVGKKLYLRGIGNTRFYTKKGVRFVLSDRAACSGNIQTLLEYSNPPSGISVNACYKLMFYGCTNLTKTPELPATTLASSCYQGMFGSCTSLTEAPELPATTLASYCCEGMFSGCTSLTKAPELPATTLAGSCYQSMFSYCTSLTKAPELPATTLASYCYEAMFYKCTGIKISSTQSSEYPTAWRIPSSGTISSSSTGWNSNMLLSTGGTFTDNPSINTTYYGTW